MTLKVFCLIPWNPELQASSLGSLRCLSDDCCFNGRIATFTVNLGGAPNVGSLEGVLSLAPAPGLRGLYGSCRAWAVHNTGRRSGCQPT